MNELRSFLIPFCFNVAAASLRSCFRLQKLWVYHHTTSSFSFETSASNFLFNFTSINVRQSSVNLFYCRELCRISPRWYQTRRRKEPPGSLLSSSPGWRMAASGGKWKFRQITFKFAPIISTSCNQGGGAGEHGRGRVSLHQQGHVCRLQGRSWLCSGLNWKYSKELPDNLSPPFT